jgi:hypothetical protein
MKSPPYCEKALLVLLDDPKRIAGVGYLHVVVLPKRRGRLPVTQENEDFASVRALDMHVRGLVLPRRRIHVYLESAIVVDPHHRSN